MTLRHSPLPWTINEAGDIVDRHGLIVADGAGFFYREDRPRIVTAVNAHERMKKALEEIASFPAHETVPSQYTAWEWITNAKTIDIACEALGLCRECRKRLNSGKQACHTCGATIARAALAGE